MKAIWNGCQRPVGRHVDVLVEVGLPAPAHLLGVERVGALEPHGPVHEAERLARLRVLLQQLQPGLDPVEVLPALLDGLGGGVAEILEAFWLLSLSSASWPSIQSR